MIFLNFMHFCSTLCTFAQLCALLHNFAHFNFNNFFGIFCIFFNNFSALKTFCTLSSKSVPKNSLSIILSRFELLRTYCCHEIGLKPVLLRLKFLLKYKTNYIKQILGCRVYFLSMVEGGNIKYGNIEKCNIDSDLRSKIWRRVTSKKKDGNIKFSIDLFNIDSKNGVKTGSNRVPVGWGVGGGPPADDDRGCYDPV